jgi:hypothetical protein
MSLVFAGVCSHAPGITGRAARAEPVVRDAFYAGLDELRRQIEAARPDALIVVAAEHFANFFMDNMPAYCMQTRVDHGGRNGPQVLGQADQPRNLARARSRADRA